MLYVATTDDQPLVDNPELNVKEVQASADSVRQWFSLPAVRYVGSYTGCGCGFRHVLAEEPINYWEGMFDDSDHSSDEALNSALALIAVIRTHVAAGEVQLYPVWNGDEQLAPKGTIELQADTLDPRTFFFTERFFYRVLPAAGSR